MRIISLQSQRIVKRVVGAGHVEANICQSLYRGRRKSFLHTPHPPLKHVKSLLHAVNFVTVSVSTE